MANYYAAARSNYFKVKDPEEFKARMSDVPGLVVWEGQNESRAGMFAVAGDDPDTGSWPYFQWDEEAEEYLEIDLFDLVAEHLEEGQVAIFFESGHEKLRYVSGFAVAVNWCGDRVSVSLDDIYTLAEKSFGVSSTTAEY